MKEAGVDPHEALPDSDPENDVGDIHQDEYDLKDSEVKPYL